MEQRKESLRQVPHHEITLIKRSLLTGLVVLLLHGIGALDPIDRWLIGRLVSGQPFRAREQAPVLVALDQATVDRWGPPPWPIDRWRTLARALQGVGVDQADLVEPWQRVLTADAGTPVSGELSPSLHTTSDGAMARIRVPRVVMDQARGDGVLTASQLREPDPPLYPWDAQLYLPAQSDGSIRSLTRASLAGDHYGQSTFCSWTGHCPTGGENSLIIRTLGPGGALPTVSVSDIIDGRLDLANSDQSERTFLIGLTAPWHAQFVFAGPTPQRMTQAEAVGLAIASARKMAPTPEAGRVGDALIILGTLLIFGLIYRTNIRIAESWLVAVLPLMSGIIGATLSLTGAVDPPLTAMIVVAALPPALTSLGSRGITLDFLRKVMRVIVREGFVYSPRAVQLKTRHDLLLKLGALSRNHSVSGNCVYYHRIPQTDRLEFFGGFGLGRSEHRSEVKNLREPPFSTALKQPLGEVSADLFRAEDLRTRLLPLLQEDQLIGFWGIVFRVGEPEPNPQLFARLAQWLAPRLAIEPHGPRRWTHRRKLDRIEHEMQTVQELFLASSEERRRQFQTLDYLDLPLLVADVSGALLIQNRAMSGLLASSGLGAVISVRELLFKLHGEEGLQEKTRRLFEARQTLSFSWTARENQTYLVTVYPVFGQVTPGSEDLLGYLAQFEDISLSLQLKKLRGSVVDMTTSHVRNELMAIMSNVAMIKIQGIDPPAAPMLDSIKESASHISEVLKEFAAVVGLEEELERTVVADFTEVIQVALTLIRGLPESQGIEFDISMPEFSMPVSARPAAAQQQLVALLRHACQQAHGGSSIMVRMEEHTEGTRIILHWPGSGYDGAYLAILSGTSGVEGETLPDDLRIFAEARKIFTELEVASTPGEGVTVTLPLTRASLP